MVRRQMWAAGLGVVVLGVLGVAGCKPKAGDSCEQGKRLCQDPKTEMWCQDGKLATGPCKGPKGCTTEGTTMRCDISANAVGEPCSPDDQDAAACTADGKSMVVCEKGKYAIRPCRGPKACKELGKVDCDESMAQLGDACSGAGYKCSVDGKSLLQCKDGKAALDEKCPEGESCKVAGNEVGCSK